MKRTLSLIFALIAVVAMAKAEHNIANCRCDACMSEKIGRMIMTGFKGTEPSKEIEHAIKELHIGGVILFDRDLSNGMGERNIRSPKQVKELTDQLQSYTDGSLLIAIDQEGGMVNRLKTQYGFPPSVTASRQGEIGALDSCSHYAAQTAQTLTQCGINVNFVPCVDVNINPSNPIIGKYGRAFSSDPDSVYLLAERWVKEHHKQKVITSLKHFPGHGSSLDDSHLGLVDITSTWNKKELIPYQRFVDNGYQGIVMVGHLINKNIDPDYPASLSEKTLQGVLRNQIGFKGVIATDDMNMGAIVDHYSFEKALVLAINAGVNLIIIGNNAKVYEENLPTRCHSIIKTKVANGEIEPSKIDDSYRRLKAMTLFERH